MVNESAERNDIVELARELEVLADVGGADFDRLLRDFNARTRASCDRDTFRFMYQSEEPDEFVERLLEIRDAPPFVLPGTREELALVLERAAAPDASFVDGDRAGLALAHMSRLPRDLAHQLGSGFGWLPCWPSREEIVAFALDYEPATTREELYPLLRRWIQDTDAGRCSVYAALGEALFFDRHAALALRELDTIVKQLRSGIDVQCKAGIASLKKALGISAHT